MAVENIYTQMPDELPQELVDVLVESRGLRIERILSQGQCSPESGWYDQDEQEWVLVLKGRGRIEFEDGEILSLAPGDHVNIPARRRHRVAWTDPDQVTVWLAVFYR